MHVNCAVDRWCNERRLRRSSHFHPHAHGPLRVSPAGQCWNDLCRERELMNLWGVHHPDGWSLSTASLAAPLNAAETCSRKHITVISPLRGVTYKNYWFQWLWELAQYWDDGVTERTEPLQHHVPVKVVKLFRCERLSPGASRGGARKIWIQ